MLHQQIESNKQRTILIVFLFFALFAGLGAAIGYLNWNDALSGLVIALVVGAAYVAIMFAQSTKVVMSLNNAREITDKAQYPMLWNIVDELTIVTRLPFPKIFIIEDESPNAFAAGNSPEKASVAVTTGLLKQLNREELPGYWRMNLPISEITTSAYPPSPWRFRADRLFGPVQHPHDVLGRRGQKAEQE